MNSPDPLSFRKRRISAGIPIVKVALITGVSYTHLCNIDRGVARPSPKLAQILAETLNTTPENLWCFHAKKNKKGVKQ